MAVKLILANGSLLPREARSPPTISAAPESGGIFSEKEETPLTPPWGPLFVSESLVRLLAASAAARFSSSGLIMVQLSLMI